MTDLHLNENRSTDARTVTTTGNSIDGTQTMVTTGSQSYTVSQTNTDGSDNYTLSETGTKDYTRTENDNAENGVSSIGETGTDSYTMVQNGTSSGSVYTVTVSGTDTYTIADDENAQTGSFDSVTSGTDDYTTYSNPLFLSGQNPFSSTEVGNSFAGTLSLTQSGTKPPQSSETQKEGELSPSDSLRANATPRSCAFGAHRGGSLVLCLSGAQGRLMYVPRKWY